MDNNLHQFGRLDLIGGDTLTRSEILLFYTSTKRSSNYASFDKISKSGDSGRSGGILHTLAISTAV
jgi:hypothetical protein